MKFYLIAHWIQFLSIFASFITSFILHSKIKKFNYLKGFNIYTAIGLIGICISIFVRQNFNDRYQSELHIFFKILLLFHYYFIGFKIVQILTLESIKKIAFRFYFVLGLAVLIITSINIWDGKGIYSFAFANFSLITLSIIYYYEIFQLPPHKKLHEMPSFWLVNGVFLSMSLSIPINLFEYYIKKNLDNNSYPIIIAVSCISYIILHIFLMKSFYSAKINQAN